MSLVATEWRSLRSQVLEHRAQLGLSLRVTIAALSGFALFALAQGPSAAVDGADGGDPDPGDLREVGKGDRRLSGWHSRRRDAGAVAVLIPHPHDVSLAGVLALAVAPLAFLGAVYPSFSAASVHGRVGALDSRNSPRGPDRIRSRSCAGGRGRRRHRTGGVASSVAGPRAFVCDRGRGSDARTDGGVPARIVCGVRAASRRGGDRAHPGQHWPICRADARQSPLRRGTSG